MSVESNPRLHWLSFSLLCDWVRKLASHSQPIRCKTKTYPDLVARVFPRFRLIGCSYFELSLGLRVIFLFFDWLLRFIGFFYTTLNRKAFVTDDLFFYFYTQCDGHKINLPSLQGIVVLNITRYGFRTFHSTKAKSLVRFILILVEFRGNGELLPQNT